MKKIKLTQGQSTLVSEIEAAKTYNRAARKYFEEFVLSNEVK